jgi:hypothetical protein
MDELKIRGKRKRREPQGSPAPRQRGRPLKSVAEIRGSKKANAEDLATDVQETQHSSSAEKPGRNSSLSCIERLPTELVQQIFFDCLEVNMIKASTVLAKILSTDSTYKLLILFAFFDDDGVNPVETDNFKPVSYRCLSVQERVRLQEAILSSRWCSLKMIQDCLPILTRLKIVQAWHEEHNATKNKLNEYPSKWIKPDKPDCPPFLPPLDDHPALRYYFQVYLRGTEKAGAKEFQPVKYLPWIMPYRLHLGQQGRLYKAYHYSRDRHGLEFPSTLATRCIPDKLLTGQPWTLEKMDFLKLLRQGFRHLTRDFILQISPAALFSGMADAINENEPTALLILLELHDAAFHIKSRSISGHIVRNQNPHNQRYTTCHAQPLPLYLFHLAIKQPYISAEILLSLLIRGGLDSLPKDDAALTKWAITAATTDASLDSIAAFILIYMEGGFTSMVEEVDIMFLHGKLRLELPQHFKWLTESTFADDIGYEHPSTNCQFSVQVESGAYT